MSAFIDDENIGFGLANDAKVRQLADLDEIIFAQACNREARELNMHPAALTRLVDKKRRDRVKSPNIKPIVGAPSVDSLRLTIEELQAARITPTCIVENYLYSDVGTIAAPGGTGKTTLVLFEMACIALGRPIHGLEVRKPGRCLLITSEDRREQCAARLREIMGGLSDAEMQTVLNGIMIWDVTGEPLRLVTSMDGNIMPTGLADTVISLLRDNPPVLVIFDPAVSFGASEAMVNDNEQAIITACRRIVRELDCCVRLVAHTGKANAREKTLDQYTSRGGSALSDGARMVAVLQPWTPGSKSEHRPPSGCTASPDSSTITILARPKLSYAPANLPLIWIKRTGWTYESFTEIHQSSEERQAGLFEQIERFLAAEVKAGVRHLKSTLENVIPGTTRSEARKAIGLMMARGIIVESDLPKDEQRTKKKTYLTTAGFGGIQKSGSTNDADETCFNNAAAYRENNGGIIPPPIFPQFSNAAKDTRQDSAGLAGLPESNEPWEEF